ncbi:MAG: AMP-binding protein [Bryobacteraceae bacterium]
MNWPRIAKTPAKAPANLADYREAYSHFDWNRIRGEVEELPSGGLNIAYSAVTRHAGRPARDRVAFRFLGKDGSTLDVTYSELERRTNQFANVLRSLGIGKGDAVFSLAGRIPALYVAALGSLKNGSVFCPRFSAFGPEPIHQRLSRGDAKLLITTERLYRKNVAALRTTLPKLAHVLLADSVDDLDPTVLSFGRVMASAAEEFPVAQTAPEDPALLHFTSGTTGMPKGAVHVHEAVLMHYMTGKYALDLHPDDIFWCTADPGWVTGTSYGIIGAPAAWRINASSTKRSLTPNAGMASWPSKASRSGTRRPPRSAC